jgi:hypothetical protein
VCSVNVPYFLLLCNYCLLILSACAGFYLNVEKIEFFGDSCCWVVDIVSNCYCYCFVEFPAKMAVTFYNLKSESGLKKLNEFLLTRSYITG